MTTIPKQYPADISPQPVLCYSTERLCSTAGLVPIVLQKIDGSTFSANFTDDHLPAGYSSFLTGEPYGKVITVTNQMPNGVGHLTINGVAIPPSLRPDIKVGPSPALVFQGGTDQGNVWGLDITPGIHTAPAPIFPNNYTVMAVLRPTTSMFRNQSNTPGEADGTILSLDTRVPFATPGDTIAGSATITGVDETIPAVGDYVHGLPLPFGNAQVLQINPSGAGKVSVQLFGAGAISTGNALFTFTHPVIRCYQSGDGSPGSFAMSDMAAFGGDKKLQPQDFSGAEIQPVVVAWTQNNGNATTDVVGQKVWMNEIVRSSPNLTTRPIADAPITGFVGRLAGRLKFQGLSTGCGDFWLGALMVWSVALTQAQRAVVADSLYRRFAIPESRSIRSVKNVMIMGDSITADYTTFANYGWSKRLADKFSSGVRFLNYAVPGSQATTAPGAGPTGSTDDLFRVAVKRNIAYSKAGKNVLIVLAGGNDMIDQTPYQYTIDVATNEIAVFNDAEVSANAAAGSTTIQFVTLPRWLSVGALVQNLTTPASIPAGRTITAIDTTTNTVTLSGAVAAPGVAQHDAIRFRYHNMQANGRLQFTSLPLDGGGNPTTTGIGIGVTYYVKTVSTVDKYTISATPGGAVIDIGGSFVGEQSMIEFTKTATKIFGTPTTEGLQRIVAEANAAGASRVYLLTVLKRTGTPYDFIREELNALIMGGGAGGYTPLNCDSDSTLNNNDTPPGTAGPAYPDGTHLNELGSDALANFIYPTLNAYLNS